jgi:hypothetical protein
MAPGINLPWRLDGSCRDPGEVIGVVSSAIAIGTSSR